MSKHICQENKNCTCSISAYEPEDNCPIHGAGCWPPRCEICGRFMKREQQKNHAAIYCDDSDCIKKAADIEASLWKQWEGEMEYLQWLEEQYE